MATLYTAPRSRPVIYSKTPPSLAQLNKIAHRNAIIDQVNKALRIVAEQVPAFGSIRNALTTDTFIFPGIQTIKWQMAREITEQYGLQSYTMLPWYTKALAITVTGKSYLGAWATDLTASGGLVNTSLQSKSAIEFIRAEMLDLDSKLSGIDVVSNNQNQLNSRTKAGGDTNSGVAMVSSLSIGNDGEQGSIKVLGFIKSFDVEEDVASPYVQKYTLVYLGVDQEWYAESRARNRFGLDGTQISSSIERQANSNNK